MSELSEHFVGAVFDNSDDANAVVEELIKHDFPMDQVSILHKAGGHGDDIFGIAYINEKERFKVWGLEGALGGLLAGTAGLFLLPGIGAVLIGGPFVSVLVSGAVGAGLMTTGAAMTHLTIAQRRLGIPEAKLKSLHQAVMDGRTILLLHCANEDPQVWRQRLVWTGADPVFTMP
jgi:hypothetical protein